MKILNISLFGLLILASCSKNMVVVKDNGFKKLLNDYYQEEQQLNPLEATTSGSNLYNDKLAITISDEHIAQTKLLNEKYLKALEGIDRLKLSSEERNSYDILKLDCEMNLEKQQFHPELLPMSQMDGLPLNFTMLAYGTGAQPFKTVQDYDNWLQRMNTFSTWFDVAIARMNEGIEKGYVWPKSIVQRVMSQYGFMALSKTEGHIFYTPIKNMPGTFSADDKKRLTEAYSQVISEKIKPAFTKMYYYLQKEYLPKARETHGISDLPNGKAYYHYLIKYWTTTSLTADEIHEMGLEEVARINKEMIKIKEATNFESDLQAYFEYLKKKKELMPFETPEEVILNFRNIHKELMPKVNELFAANPTIPFEIRQVEKFREATASASYQQGMADGSRPGIFYVPIPNAKTYNTITDESLFIHEAIPGHHYQVALMQENKNLPAFRRLKWYGAYGEGWGLYCESLGKDLGMYNDVDQYFGMLVMEMHRAIRLVVDTGIHAKGWSREDAIKYSLENEATTKVAAASEIDRYIAIPGQALSYKIGQLKLMELRAKVESELGSKFNIKEFHTKVLESGSLPLNILEHKINEWIVTTK